ncbi:MAG: four helix bundle protein [Paludibacter sp.]|nr:four helix bundle protein [Paludibacter sp.]
MINNFEELEVWKESRNLRMQISIALKSFPSEEKYRLVDQLIRATRSVTANIAEGHGRYHYQENIQFCRQARGSLTETLDHLICANDENYISTEQLNNFRNQYALCLKLLNGYTAYLQKMKLNESSKLVK